MTYFFVRPKYKVQSLAIDVYAAP